MRLNRYRIIQKSELWFEIEEWHILWPFWISSGFGGPSFDYAKDQLDKIIRERSFKKKVVWKD